MFRFDKDLCKGTTCPMKKNCARYVHYLEAKGRFYLIVGEPYEISIHGIVSCSLFMKHH